MRACDVCHGQIVDEAGLCPHCGEGGDLFADLTFPANVPPQASEAVFRFDVAPLEGPPDADFSFDSLSAPRSTKVDEPQFSWSDEDLQRVAESAGNATGEEVEAALAFNASPPAREPWVRGRYRPVPVPATRKTRRPGISIRTKRAIAAVSWPKMPRPRVPHIALPRMPQLAMPRLSLPRMPHPTMPRLALPRMPHLAMPHVTLPRMPSVRLPVMPRLSLPKMPRLSMPRLSLPKMPRLRMPHIALPRMPAVTLPAMPRLAMPHIALPRMPRPTMPRLALPRLALPRMPRLAMPHIALPRMPAMTLPSMPRLTLPRMPHVPMPHVALPRMPAVTLPSMPRLSLPRMPRLAMPHITLPRMPAVTLPAMPRLSLPRMPTVTLPPMPRLVVIGPALVSAVGEHISAASTALKRWLLSPNRGWRQGPFLTDRLPHLAYALSNFSRRRQLWRRRFAREMRLAWRQARQLRYAFEGAQTRPRPVRPRPAAWRRPDSAAPMWRAVIVRRDPRHGMRWAAALLLLCWGGYALATGPNWRMNQNVARSEAALQTATAGAAGEVEGQLIPAALAEAAAPLQVAGVPLPLPRIDHLTAASARSASQSRARLSSTSAEAGGTRAPLRKKFRRATRENFEASTNPTRPILPAAEMRERGPYSPDAIANAQIRLTELGYPAGSVLGRYNSGTRQAILRFQRDAGVPETGRIDSTLMSQLEDAVANR